MDNLYFITDWFGNQNSDRQSVLFDEKPTATERYYLRDLLKAVGILLSEFEDRLRILEENRKNRVATSGSQENEITSSFEALLFWFRLFEKKVAAYSDKILIETEFEPRIKIVKIKMRILINRNSHVTNEAKMPEGI